MACIYINAGNQEKGIEEIEKGIIPPVQSRRKAFDMQEEFPTLGDLFI